MSILVGFTAMCLLVKEGKYPPPAKLAENKWKFSGVAI